MVCSFEQVGLPNPLGGFVKKVTIKELANHTGLSTATIDRILHNRSGVSEKSRRKIEQAIRELGFGGWNRPRLTPQREKLRFLFLLPEMNSPFSAELRRSILAAPQVIEDFHVLPEIRQISLRDPRIFNDVLDAIDPNQYQGVAVFALDAPGAREAIDRAVLRGANVVTMVSDIPASLRRFFVGIDNTAAGRLAGTLMGKFLPGKRGKIGIITDNTRQRNHIDRLYGFRQIIDIKFPKLEILPVIEGLNNRGRNASLLRRFIDRRNDLVGIYSISSDNRGVIDVLDEYGISEELVVIVHELTADTRAALEARKIDAVVAQNIGDIARSAVRVLRAFHCRSPIIEDQEKMTIEFYIADNLP